jgi:hypothetical protein
MVKSGARRGGDRRFLWDHRGAKRSWRGVAQRGVLGRWWASGWGSAVLRDRRGAKRSWWRVAQRGVLGRWWAGRPASPPTVEIKRWYRRRFWAAPTPIRAKWGCELPPRIVSGMRGCHHGTPWLIVRPPTLAMAHRAATKDRIGVGAVQNRPNGLRDDRDIAGDAGQPAHQRPKTPHSATPRDAPIPHPDAPRPAPPRDAPRKKDDAPS